MTARLEAPPTAVAPCPTCGDLTARGYPDCPGCAAAVDHRWLAAWAALPDPDASAVIYAPLGEYPWECVDWALRQLGCEECGGEMAAGDPDCVECAAADALRWELPAGSHAVLRRAVGVLRAPGWWRQATVSTWRLALPFVLAGVPVRGFGLVRTQVLAGRYEELAACTSWPPRLPLLPWRRSTI